MKNGNSDSSGRKKRGRPPFPPERCRSERVVTFVTTAELAELNRLAQHNKQPLSATVHQVLRKGLLNGE